MATARRDRGRSHRAGDPRAYALTANWQRAGLLTTVLIVGFFGYGHAWNAAAGVLDSQWPLIVAWGCWSSSALVAAWRATATVADHPRAEPGRGPGADPERGSVAARWSPSDRSSPRRPTPTASWTLTPATRTTCRTSTTSSSTAIAGPTALRETYGYDNEPFLEALEERGFTVARHAHANYIKTPLSLAAR